MSKNNQNNTQAENKKDYSRYENKFAENKEDASVPNRARTEMKNQAQNKKNDKNCR